LSATEVNILHIPTKGDEYTQRLQRLCGIRTTYCRMVGILYALNQAGVKAMGHAMPA